MRGADMMAARDWLAGVTDKGGKPPAGIAPTDTKGVLAAGIIARPASRWTARSKRTRSNF
jgi:hypothetical protein